MKKAIIAGLILISLFCIAAGSDKPVYNTSYPELEDAVRESGISQVEYKFKIYDCREMSAVLDYHLKSRGFDSGLCLIGKGDVGHRIVWVRLPNETVFIEPQTEAFYKLEELAPHYGNVTLLKFYDYNPDGSDLLIDVDLEGGLTYA